MESLSHGMRQKLIISSRHTHPHRPQLHRGGRARCGPLLDTSQGRRSLPLSLHLYPPSPCITHQFRTTPPPVCVGCPLSVLGEFEPTPPNLSLSLFQRQCPPTLLWGSLPPAQKRENRRMIQRSGPSSRAGSRVDLFLERDALRFSRMRVIRFPPPRLARIPTPTSTKPNVLVLKIDISPPFVIDVSHHLLFPPTSTGGLG